MAAAPDNNNIPLLPPVWIKHYATDDANMSRNIFAYLRYMNDALTKYSHGSREREAAFRCAREIYIRAHTDPARAEDWQNNFYRQHVRFEHARYGETGDSVYYDNEDINMAG